MQPSGSACAQRSNSSAPEAAASPAAQPTAQPAATGNGTVLLGRPQPRPDAGAGQDSLHASQELANDVQTSRHDVQLPAPGIQAGSANGHAVCAAQPRCAPEQAAGRQAAASGPQPAAEAAAERSAAAASEAGQGAQPSPEQGVQNYAQQLAQPSTTTAAAAPAAAGVPAGAAAQPSASDSAQPGAGPGQAAGSGEHYWGQALQYLDRSAPIEAGRRLLLLAKRDGAQVRALPGGPRCPACSPGCLALDHQAGAPACHTCARARWSELLVAATPARPPAALGWCSGGCCAGPVQAAGACRPAGACRALEAGLGRGRLCGEPPRAARALLHPARAGGWPSAQRRRLAPVTHAAH